MLQDSSFRKPTCHSSDKTDAGWAFRRVDRYPPCRSRRLPPNPLDANLARNRPMSSTKTRSSTSNSVIFKTRAGGFLPRWRGLRGRRSNGRPSRSCKMGAARHPLGLRRPYFTAWYNSLAIELI
jgi:hypothetical protein